jgi:hypothetical protein
MMPADPWASLQSFHDAVGPYLEAGIDEFLIDLPSPAQFHILEQVAATVLADRSA